MKKGIIIVVFKGILLSLLPALCTYLGQDDNVLYWLQKNEYLGSNVDLAFLSNVMNILAIGSTFIMLTVPLILNEMKARNYAKQRDAMIKNNREIFEVTLKNELGLDHCSLNVRIFVPKHSMLYHIRKKIKKPMKLEYHIQNIEGLADNDITTDLKFEVCPNVQGLVGECYRDKAILYDDDLEHSNEVIYNLSQHQIAKTHKLKFSLVCPIFSKMGDDVVGIVAIDSCDSIKIKESSKDNVRRLVLNYTQTLYECVPELFKAKGGIL